MEERIIDKDEDKIIRIKRTKDGETDAVDALSREGEEEMEEEILIAVPEEEGDEEEEYDEDLVGLTPHQLEAELARRAKLEEAAREEYEALKKSAQEALEKQDYAEALPFLEQATCYAFADEEVEKALWQARTNDFTDDEPLFQEEYAQEFAESADGVKEYVRSKVGARLQEQYDEAKKEEERIAPEVEKKQEERRLAFLQNRKYYAPYLIAFACVTALFLAGCAVSASFIVKTLSILPVVFTGVCGGLAFAALVAFLVYFRKWLVAHRLCRFNEKLSSTQDGERLEELRAKLSALDVILNA